MKTNKPIRLYCVVIDNKYRSKPVSRYKAYKIRKHFKLQITADIKVKEYGQVVFIPVYNTLYLYSLGLI